MISAPHWLRVPSLHHKWHCWHLEHQAVTPSYLHVLLQLPDVSLPADAAGGAAAHPWGVLLLLLPAAPDALHSAPKAVCAPTSQKPRTAAACPEGTSGWLMRVDSRKNKRADEATPPNASLASPPSLRLQ